MKDLKDVGYIVLFESLIEFHFWIHLLFIVCIVCISLQFKKKLNYFFPHCVLAVFLCPIYNVRHFFSFGLKV